ncbi:hypothetical protein GCM10011416_15760 [Polaribacter pacificus]|uniref:Acyltransferase 3 domain-containing protein n=1 Tax=Polaribacter pacificus TaxID=1775173 RepID=A0A917ME03_9FLAO|nr:acyltransferase [Polaribacter pacificus]GGG98458.1 hypothetical protein GCM10011416_15760 [Polaribacter pacificus]
MSTNTRRYELDWLRVIAILAVYFHHIGMPFNGDGFHIMNTTSSKLLDNVMVYFEQFRLPLLFMISGAGTFFAFSKRSWLQFIKERSYRLLIPLVFGVLFIVPPQTYYENITRLGSYLDIYKNLDFEVNHLWFIENLWVWSVLLIPFILFLKSPKSNDFKGFFDRIILKKYGLFIGVIPLLSIFIILKQQYPEDSKSISNLSVSFYHLYFFSAGMLLAATKQVWESLKKYRRTNLVILLVCTALFYGYYFMPNQWIEPYLSLANRWSLWYAVCCLVGWSFVITLLGYSQVWFAKNSKLLLLCNEAIYPFYILHQTVIIVVGYYIIEWDLPISAKIFLLLIVTFPVILLLYRFVVYPFNFLRLVFGMKKKSTSSS